MTRDLISLKYFYNDNFSIQFIKHIFYPIIDIILYMLLKEHFSFLILPIWFNHFILIILFILGLTLPERKYDKVIIKVEGIRALLFVIYIFYILYLVEFKFVYFPKINIFIWSIPTLIYFSIFMIFIIREIKKYFIKIYRSVK